MATREIRLLSGPVEIRQSEKGDVLVGTPVVYNVRSELLYGYFREYIMPEAFKEHLAEGPDIQALMHHNPELVLGRTSSGTLTLDDRKDALHCEVTLPDTSYARDLRESVKRKDIKGMSFAFDTISDDWKMVEGVPTRTVLKARIYEVSAVTNPAYPDTGVALKRCREFVEGEEARASDQARTASRYEMTLKMLRQRLNERI
jgi:uncharacterized protein